MKLSFAAIASGSNGNCYYIGNDNEAVLVDAGISCREIEQRMKRLELSIKKVKAIFVSHEHTDHVRGVRVLSKKYNLPIFISRSTLLSARLEENNPLNCYFTPDKPVQVGDLHVTCFNKFHDASDPHSFVVRYKNLCVGVFTDIGSPCENVVKHFSCCDAVFLEANYDDEMLFNGPYPYYLKQRISSDKGHLSNKQALDLFLNHRKEKLSHVFLSHLSRENNDPVLAKKLFDENAGGSEIIVASRYQETNIYHLPVL